MKLFIVVLALIGGFIYVPNANAYVVQEFVSTCLWGAACFIIAVGGIKVFIASFKE